MAFRFVHAADIHLDSPLRSLALRDAALAELIGNATRRAFTAIVDLCLDERVDALLLVGDLYDGEQTSMKTARFLAEQLRRLDAAGVRVFIIRGNHDADSRITTELTLPDSVKIFTGRADAVTFAVAGGLSVALHGMSFRRPAAPDCLLPNYRAPVADALNIGLMHTSLDGSPGHDVYAPCKLIDLQNSGFTYWALGHIHKRVVYPGQTTVVMPGMPQGRDINEAGMKSVTLVTIADDRSVQVKEHPTSIAQFERVIVDVTSLSDWRDIVSAIGQGLSQAKMASRSEHVIARLRVNGTTPLAWRLRQDIELLKGEAADRAGALGNCWVEGVEVVCQAPAATASVEAAGVEPLLELRRLIETDVVPSEPFQADIQAIADELRKQLPRDYSGILRGDEAAFASLIGDVVRGGVEEVLARLQPRDGMGNA